MDLGGWRYVFRLPVLTMLPALAFFWVFAAHHTRSSATKFPAKQKRHPLAFLAFWSHYRPLLRNVRFVLFCLSIGFESAARYGLLVWVPIHLLGHAWHASATGKWLSLLLPFGMSIGAACTGILSDRLFHRNRVQPIVLLMTLGAVMTGALYWVPSSNSLLSCLLLFLAGFAVFGPQAAYWTVGTEVGGAERSGIAIGMMDGTAYIFAALGEGCIGWAVDRAGTTSAIFPTIACACVLAGCFALPLLIRPTAAT